MMSSPPITDVIAREILEGRCVLVLGPNAFMADKGDGDLRPIKEVVLNIVARKNGVEEDVSSFEEILSRMNKLTDNSGHFLKLQMDIARTIRELERYVTLSPLSDKIARLPFKIILNAGPDNLLTDVFARLAIPFHTAFYDFDTAGQLPNDEFEFGEQFPTLIYNLYGSVMKPESLVFTSRNQDRYEKAIIRHGLPVSIKRELLRNDTFVFLGFDGKDWTTRQTNETLFSENSESNRQRKIAVGPETSVSYSFGGDFYPMGINEFVDEVFERCLQLDPDFIKKQSKATLAIRRIRDNIEKYGRGEDATILDLSRCDLIEIPIEIIACEWVTTLILTENNQLENIYAISGLLKLQNLDISFTKVADLSTLSNLISLQELLCGFSSISDLLPLSALTNLKTLKCYNTQVADLSPLSGLSNLEVLNCSSTPVRDLSPLLPLIEKGRRITLNGFTDKGVFDFKDCPLENPPIEVVRQGNEAILRYFEEKKIVGEVHDLEAKVILMGEGRSGKTSLLMRLTQGIESPMPVAESTTRGIEVSAFTVILSEGRELKLNIFDFGGQQIYRPISLLFYSSRALYILVTRNGDDSNDLDYWLEMVQLFGQESSVIIVNNLFGDRPSAFNRKQYDRFDHIIKDVLDVNLNTGVGIDEVKERIFSLASNLPHVRQVIPNSWSNIRRKLEANSFRNIITLQEYLRLCTEEGIGEDSGLFCAAYLHEIGVCLHYQQVPALRNLLVLRPEWVLEAVSRVWDDQRVISQNGRFDSSILQNIWQGDGAAQFEEYQAELLAIMQRINLCYPLKNDKGFIIPSLLPYKREGESKWMPDQDLQVRVEYKFMPPGLFSRFLVLRCEDIAGTNQDQAWRDEFFLNQKNAEANVSQPLAVGRKHILLRVKGSSSKAKKILLSSLLRDLRQLHLETPGIKAEEFISCNCETCINSGQPTFYSIANLEKRKENGKESIECDKPPYNRINIDKLLGDVFENELEEDITEVETKPEELSRQKQMAEATLLTRFSAPGPKYLLAIEGGDAEVLGQLALLAAFEEKMRTKTGNSNYRISDTFDLIGGAGLGNLVAMQLSLGRTVLKIKEDLESMSNDVRLTTFSGVTQRLARHYAEEERNPTWETGFCYLKDASETWLEDLTNHPEHKLLLSVFLAKLANPSGHASLSGPTHAILLHIATHSNYPFGWSFGEENLHIFSVESVGKYADLGLESSRPSQVIKDRLTEVKLKQLGNWIYEGYHGQPPLGFQPARLKRLVIPLEMEPSTLEISDWDYLYNQAQRELESFDLSPFLPKTST